MIGGLGGFVLPLLFGWLNDVTGLWSELLHGAVRAGGRLAWADARGHPAGQPAQLAAPPDAVQEPAEISSLSTKLVVIGAGMASGRVLEHLFEDNPGQLRRHAVRCGASAATTTASCSRRC